VSAQVVGDEQNDVGAGVRHSPHSRPFDNRKSTPVGHAASMPDEGLCRKFEIVFGMMLNAVAPKWQNEGTSPPAVTRLPSPMSILLFFVVLAVMLAVGLFSFGPKLRAARCERLGIILMVVFCLLGVPSFFAVVSFVAAEPASVIRANDYDIPPDWTAGVMNHGSYYRWYTIKERPALFALSVVVLAVSVVPLQALLLYAFCKRKRNRTKAKAMH
jgi:hypothetical protein